MDIVEKIVGDEKKLYKKVKFILNWMKHNIKKEPIVSVPNALQVLKLKVGDCNEHAALMTALCRAACVPARVCVGVVYVNGRFYYHSWVEVFIREWIPVDPVFSQFPVDPTHIRMVVGNLEKQVKLVNAVNRMSIEVVDFK